MDQLPNEILLKILNYLDTLDLLQFCEAYKNLDYFLKERHLVETLNLSRGYELHTIELYKIISGKMDPSHIKVLKIDGIYWISSQDLAKLLNKLINLEELYAVDTKLGLTSKCIVESSNLKKLAISAEDTQLVLETVKANKISLKSLKSLYLKIAFKYSSHFREGMRFFFEKITQLEELWIQIDQNSIYKVNVEDWLVNLKHLRKMVVRSENMLTFDVTFLGLSKTFERSLHREVIFELLPPTQSEPKKSIFDPKETELEKAWDLIVRSYGNYLCGTKEYKLLILGEDVHNILFEELSFYQTLLCETRYVQAALQVLQSKNCRHLKKLNFESCLFQNFQKSKKQDEVSTVMFKKARMGVKKDSVSQLFEKVSQNLKDLIELMIHTCPSCIGIIGLSGYSLIANFEKLQKLVLDIPYLLDGSFLTKVLNKCQQLKYFSLRITAPNEFFMKQLYQSLHLAKSLKDFRIQCPQLTIKMLLNSLCDIPTKKLSRVFISCHQITCDLLEDPQELFTFMAQNPQLIFVFLVCSQLTLKQVADIQRILNLYKNGNPAKIFYVTNKGSSSYGDFPLPPFIDSTEVFPVPPAHYDFVVNSNRVSGINFDDF